MNQLQSIWLLLNDCDCLAQSLEFDVNDCDFDVIRSYFSVSNLTRFCSLGKDDRFLSEIGLAVDVLYEVSDPSFAWHLGGPCEPEVGNYQLVALSEACLTIRSPLNGSLISSQISFFVGDVPSVLTSSRIGCFYRFEDVETFYVYSSSEYNRKYAFYFPMRELVVNLSGPDLPCYCLTIDMIAHFKAKFITNRHNFLTYLEGGAKKPAYVLSCINNMAHHLFNDLAGLQKFLDSGAFDKVDDIIVIGNEFYGRIDDIFPKLRSKRIRRFSKFCDVEEIIFKESMFGGYIGAAEVTDVTISRVRSLARLEADDDVFRLAQNFKKTHCPVLWLGLRYSGNILADQEDILFSLVEGLKSSAPNIGVVLDSFVTPNHRVVSIPDGFAFSDERTLVEKYAQRTSYLTTRLEAIGVDVYDLTGRSVSESIIWKMATDMYVAPAGTPQHRIAWIGKVPGVVHGLRAQEGITDMSAKVMESPKEILGVWGDVIAELGQHSLYSVSPDRLIQAAGRIMDPLRDPENLFAKGRPGGEGRSWPFRLKLHISNVGDVTTSGRPLFFSDNEKNQIEGLEIHTDSSFWAKGMEYRVRSMHGEWSDWVPCNTFAGTRGGGAALTGVAFRLSQEIAEVTSVAVVAEFDQDNRFVLATNGDACISENLAPLLGLELLIPPSKERL